MSNNKILHEQIGKNVYSTDTDGQLLLEFTDEIRNPKDAKKMKLKNRGVMATAIAVKIFDYLESYNIPTLFVSQYGDREILVKNTNNIPLEIVVHNYADEVYGKRVGLKAGTKLDIPATVISSSDNNTDKKEITESELATSELLSVDEVRMIKRVIMKVNALLIAYFNRRNLLLVNYKIQFGKQKGQVLLNSEIIPEICTFANKEDNLGKLSFQEKYNEIYNCLVY